MEERSDREIRADGLVGWDGNGARSSGGDPARARIIRRSGRGVQAACHQCKKIENVFRDCHYGLLSQCSPHSPFVAVDASPAGFAILAHMRKENSAHVRKMLTLYPFSAINDRSPGHRRHPRRCRTDAVMEALAGCPPRLARSGGRGQVLNVLGSREHRNPVT
jgi:hypothetical protein